MSCKGLDAGGSGTVANLAECGQFMLCPHDWAGVEDPTCQFVPDLVSNSWGGGGGQTWFDQIIADWIAADILPVFANGNSGSSCRTVLSPADSRSGTIAVGATDINDGLANFSSRGPSNHGELRPDISAPGVNVRSSHHTSDTAYATMSGTSMACPHAAGLLSLVRSVENLDYIDSKALIESATDRLTGTGQVCDGTHDTNDWPNNSFGHGRINAVKAFSKLLKK
jgi:bacillopeptidase F